MNLPDTITKDFKHLDTYMLFGSRSMARKTATETFDPEVMIGARINRFTDWDFSAPANSANYGALTAAGYAYYPRNCLSYADNLTQCIFSKEYSEGHRVHVVLRKDYALFRQVWYSIDAQFYYTYLWKRSPYYDDYEIADKKQAICAVMNQLYATAQSMT
jgi:hypothetical protein